MLATQRHLAILELLEKEGIVHTADLVRRMNVSSETIRKDLDSLEQSGHLDRVHGGAVPAASSKNIQKTPEYISFQIRSTQNLDQKAAITRYAATLVKEGQVIALDYGSTSQIMALALRDQFQKLTVITNSVRNALLLADCPGFTIILTGGVFNKEEFSLTDEPTPLLDHLHIDIFFMSATGVDPVIGCTDQGLGEAKIQQQMIRNASKTIVLADSSKFGQGSLVKLCPISDVNLIITDSGIPNDLIPLFRESQTELVILP
ncbi:MAG: DeoR/GlpR transcriptional regulator [Lachnospiraceae bacterium]|nr:DeoR/GlpR transcriptional regulator [Lachnospiraceae bacterium]